MYYDAVSHLHSGKWPKGFSSSGSCTETVIEEEVTPVEQVVQQVDSPVYVENQVVIPLAAEENSSKEVADSNNNECYENNIFEQIEWGMFDVSDQPPAHVQEAAVELSRNVISDNTEHVTVRANDIFEQIESGRFDISHQTPDHVQEAAVGRSRIVINENTEHVTVRRRKASSQFGM